MNGEIDSILQYVNVLSNEMSKIKTEQDALKVKNQCKAIVEIKEVRMIINQSFIKHDNDEWSN